jgi:hypothetical protein
LSATTWNEKNLYWEPAFYYKRKEAVELLSREGAVHHLLKESNMELPLENVDILLLENMDHGVSCCVPVIRSKTPRKKEHILCCDVLEDSLSSEEFYKKLCFWCQTAKLATDQHLHLVPVVDIEIVSSLERLAGGEVLKEGRKKFLKSAYKHLEIISAHKMYANRSEVTKVLHTLKGSSGTIGAKQLSVASRVWEDEWSVRLFDNNELKIRLSLFKMLTEYFRYESSEWSKTKSDGKENSNG